MQRYESFSARSSRSLMKFADWSPVQVYPKLLRVVSRINTKILIGNGLQENDEWIDINTSVSENGHRNVFVIATNRGIIVHKKHFHILCKASNISSYSASCGSVFHPRTPQCLALQPSSTRHHSPYSGR